MWHESCIVRRSLAKTNFATSKHVSLFFYPLFVIFAEACRWNEVNNVPADRGRGKLYTIFQNITVLIKAPSF